MSPSTPQETERRYLRTIVTYLFIALTLLAFVHLLSPLFSGRPTANSVATTNLTPSPEFMVAPPGPVAVAQASAAALVDAQAAATALRVAQEARALSRSQLQNLRHQGDDVVALTHRFEQECDRWLALTFEVLSDERGQRLATDVNAVQAYRTLTAVERPNRAAAIQVRTRVAELMQPVDAALASDDSAYLPSPGIVKALNAERRLLVQATDAYRRSTEQLEGLIAAVHGRVGHQTLAAVVQSLIADEALAEANAIAAAREVALHQVRRQIVEAEAEKVREIGRSEVERVRAEQSAATRRLDAQATRTREQGAQERLRQLAADPAIQAKFAPFLTAGRWYPTRYEGSVGWFERKPWGRTMPRPVSLHELTSGGVLDNLESFVGAATASKSRTARNNDRPHWPTPVSAADWDRCRQDFELFQQLLPVWVEMRVIPR